eukprot:scaffold20884_cov150-Skeletonema_dohrnii-CCMP3373.AAC.12
MARRRRIMPAALALMRASVARRRQQGEIIILSITFVGEWIPLPLRRIKESSKAKELHLESPLHSCARDFSSTHRLVGRGNTAAAMRKPKPSEDEDSR